MSGTFPITRNGRYKVFLKGKQTGHIYDSNTFTVRIARPPRPGCPRTCPAASSS